MEYMKEKRTRKRTKTNVRKKKEIRAKGGSERERENERSGVMESLAEFRFRSRYPETYKVIFLSNSDCQESLIGGGYRVLVSFFLSSFFFCVIIVHTV